MLSKSSSLGFLLLSDFHQGQKGADVLWPNIQERFYDDLSYLHDVAGPWEVVFFTGDLTQKGTREEFEAFSARLDELWTHFRSLGSSPILLPVPGNHDLTRPHAASAVVQALLAWNTNQDLREHFWATDDNEYRMTVNTAFLNYAAWWKACKYRPTGGLRDGVLPGDFAYSHVQGGLRIGVLGLNSAFLHLGEGERYLASLGVCIEQANAVCLPSIFQWAAEHDVCVLMTHHPLDWLGALSQEVFTSEIAPSGRFKIHMFGHMHDSQMKLVQAAGSGGHCQLQNSSLFGLAKLSNGTNRTHGFVGGRFELEGQNTKIRLWPRIAYKTSSGAWNLAVDTRFDVRGEEIRSPIAFSDGPIHRTESAGDDLVETTKAVIGSLKDAEGVSEVTTLVGAWERVHIDGIQRLGKRAEVREIDVLAAYRVGEIRRVLDEFRKNPAKRLRACFANCFDEELVQAYRRKYYDRSSEHVRAALRESIEFLLGPCDIEVRGPDEILVSNLKDAPQADYEIRLTSQRITFGYYRIDGVAFWVPLDMKRSQNPAPLAWVLSSDATPGPFQYYKTEFDSVFQEATHVYPIADR